MKKYSKLVRDKVPEIIQKSGKTAITHIAINEEYQIALCDKLREEAEEFAENPSKEEYADLAEVMNAIRAFNEWNISDIENVLLSKRLERGGFEQRIILDSISD